MSIESCGNSRASTVTRSGLTPIWVSVEETKRLIPFGTTSIYKMIKAGRLESRRLGRRRMISYASIERLGSVAGDGS